MSKTLEFKIRPQGGGALKSRDDQQDAARVYFSGDALATLQLKPGDLCELWKEGGPRATGIAWNAPGTPTIGKGVMIMHPSFRDACGFTLQDTISVTAGQPLRQAGSIILEELDNSNGTVADDEVDDWQNRLKWGKLVDAKFIFKGMVFEAILDQIKRRFMVSSLADSNPQSVTLMSIQLSTVVKIIQAGSDTKVEGVKSREELRAPDIAGLDEALAKLNSFMRYFNHQSLPPLLRDTKGLVVHGSSGTGKSHLLNKLSATSQWPTYRVTEESSKPSQISETFSQAIINEPSLVLIDDVDSILSSDKAPAFAKCLAKEMIRLTQDDSVSKARVVVLLACQSYTSLPSSLRCFGTFHEDILLPIPDTSARKRIITSLLTAKGLLSDADCTNKLGDSTHAYTIGDLNILLAKACKVMADRITACEGRHTNEQDQLLYSDVLETQKRMRPSAMYDINLQPPKIYWDDIGGQEVVKKALRRAVEVPIKYPNLMRDLGMATKKGLLLYGPPGCSKTLSAQAMATEAGFNFFAVKGAELLNMYVGESERAVRDIFARARAASPSIIFFDEIESIGSKREGRNNGVNVLTTLLNEMDGIETLEGVTVLAATNQPEALDLALLRPGRFDDLLYVAPPDQKGREAILRVRQKRANFASDVDVAQLAEMLKGHTGAEIVSVCQKAAEIVLERILDGGLEEQSASITMADFVAAAPKVKMQVTQAMVMKYEMWAAGLSL